MSDAVTIHASCVAIGGRAVLIAGPSGSGKSDLSLRLIDRGASLVSDDYTRLSVRGGALMASAPERIAGRIEVRNIGIVDLTATGSVPVAAFIDGTAAGERLPEPSVQRICGIDIPRIALALLEPSAPIKVELFLRQVTG